MDRRQAKYVAITIFVSIGIIWFWIGLSQLFHPQDYWVTAFIFSGILSLAGFCFFMVYLYFGGKY